MMNKYHRSKFFLLVCLFFYFFKLFKLVSFVFIKIVGGWCSGEAIANVEMFDPQINEWRAVASMSKRTYGVGVCVLNNFLCAIGGQDGVSYLNSVER
jgi:hypothetical protein